MNCVHLLLRGSILGESSYQTECDTELSEMACLLKHESQRFHRVSCVAQIAFCIWITRLATLQLTDISATLSRDTERPDCILLMIECPRIKRMRQQVSRRSLLSNFIEPCSCVCVLCHLNYLSFKLIAEPTINQKRLRYGQQDFVETIVIAHFLQIWRLDKWNEFHEITRTLERWFMLDLICGDQASSEAEGTRLGSQLYPPGRLHLV